MRTLYTSSGEASLLFDECKSSLPRADIASDCVKLLLREKAGETELSVKYLHEKDIRSRVARCEPSSFLLYRELIPHIRRDCERILPEGNSLLPAKKACIRLPVTASPEQLLACGIFAKTCGIKELIISMQDDAFTDMHALMSRLCGINEIWLCKESDCVLASYRRGVELLCGEGSDYFTCLSGLFSTVMNVRVKKECHYRGFVLLTPYNRKEIFADIKREIVKSKSRQILLITSSHENIKNQLCELEHDRITLLVCSSDEESIAVSRKLDLPHFSFYGENSTYENAEILPPLMRESFSPSHGFSLSPADFFISSAHEKIYASLLSFANSISKYAEKGLSDVDAETVAVRLEVEE